MKMQTWVFSDSTLKPALEAFAQRIGHDDVVQVQFVTEQVLEFLYSEEARKLRGPMVEAVK